MTCLLDELRKHSTIDLDCNDEAVALNFQPFQDMTSNQLIVLGQLKQPSHAGILGAACKAARAAKAQGHFPAADLADLAVDYATVLLGKVVALHLHPQGYVHAQTLPSLAYDTAKTVQNALQLVSIYGLAEIPKSRVCIKIPSTSAGLEACRILESEHDVRTLATTCFTFAQGMTARKNGCTYVAPYVNPLIVHLDPSKHVKYDNPLQDMQGMQVTFDLERAFHRDTHADTASGGGKTKVLAASLVTADECFSLCGISHITLSSAALALLQKTPLDAHFEEIRDRSLAYLKQDEGTPRDANSGFWTTDLEASLAYPEVDALQRDALAHFGKAEAELRAMAKQELGGL